MPELGPGDALRRFGALGAEQRLRILYELKRLGTASVRDLSAAVGTSPARLWPHLRRLQEAGLVESRGQGRAIIFSISAAGMEAALADIKALADEHIPPGRYVREGLDGENGPNGT